jgi:glutathione S-transferase
MRSPIVMKLEAKRLAKCFEAVEARLVGRDYLLDGGFSAADIAVGQAVMMGRKFVRLDGFPEMTAWMDRISERPAAQASMPPPGEGLYTRDFYEPWDG